MNYRELLFARTNHIHTQNLPLPEAWIQGFWWIGAFVPFINRIPPYETFLCRVYNEMIHLVVEEKSDG